MTKKGLLAVVNNGIEFLIGSIILIAITKLYTLEETGTWIVFITIVFVGTKFREGITQSSLIKFSTGVSITEQHSVYLLSVFITFVIEVLLGVIMWLTGLFFIEDPLSILLMSYFWITIPQSIFRIFQYISQSRLEVRSMLISNIILLIAISLAIIYATLTNVSFQNLPLIIAASYGAGCVWQILSHKAYSWLKYLTHIHIPDGYIHFAGNGVLRELFGTLSSRAYILLTASFIGYAESAFIGIASRYANLIYLPNSAYQGLLYPKACELVNKGLQQSMLGFYRRSVSWMQAAFIPYVLLLIFLGSMGIVLLHGTEFKGAIPFYVVLILAGAFVAPFGHAYGSICQALGRPELVTKVVLFNSLVNLVLSFLLIRSFGIWGAVLAPIITDLLGLFIISVIIRNVFNSSILESLPRVIGRTISLHKILIRNLKKREVLQ